MVKVIVGAEHEEFSIHTQLLAFPSPTFYRCVSQLGYESEDIKVEIDCDSGYCHTITMYSEDPSIFKVFYDWLYSGRIPGNFTVHNIAGNDRYIDTVWLDALEMGNRLEITSIVDIALGKIHELFSTEPPLIPSKQFIESLFSKLDEDLEGLQQQIAGHVVYCLKKSVDRSAFKDLVEDEVYQFSAAVGRALLGQANTVDCYLKSGFHDDRFCRVGCSHRQPFDRREDDTAPEACDIPVAPFGLRKFLQNRSRMDTNAEQGMLTAVNHPRVGSVMSMLSVTPVCRVIKMGFTMSTKPI